MFLGLGWQARELGPLPVGEVASALPFSFHSLSSALLLLAFSAVYLRSREEISKGDDSKTEPCCDGPKT